MFEYIFIPLRYFLFIHFLVVKACIMLEPTHDNCYFAMTLGSASSCKVSPCMCCARCLSMHDLCELLINGDEGILAKGNMSMNKHCSLLHLDS